MYVLIECILELKKHSTGYPGPGVSSKVLQDPPHWPVPLPRPPLACVCACASPVLPCLFPNFPPSLPSLGKYPLVFQDLA